MSSSPAKARTVSRPGERLRPDDYFAAAFELLAEGGASALTTTNVCRRLGVTTGSLYHHFASGAAFYAAFIDHWENTVSPALRRRADRAADPMERLDILFDLALTGNHDAEKAIRAWADSDPMVAAAQRRVDRVRHRHLAAAYVAVGIDEAQAANLAHIGFCILVGTQQMGERTDTRRLNNALDEYRRWVYSQLPEGE